MILSQELCRPQCSFIHIPGLCHRNCVVRSALSSISRDSVTGIMSSAGCFHMYHGTHSSIESTKILDIGRNFSYFLNLQYESRRLSSYLFKVDIDRLVAQHEDGRTDGRNTFSSLKSNDETRRHRKISVVPSADVELRTDDCQPWLCGRPSQSSSASQTSV